MENRIINLNIETPLLAEWEEMYFKRVTISGFKPLSLLPNITEVSGLIVRVKTAFEYDDGSICLHDIDITLYVKESHLNYTIRVRTTERMGEPDWDLLYYGAALHSVVSENLPHWADSFEEMERIQQIENNYPIRF